MKKIILILTISLALPLTGCIRALKPNVTQGNIVTQQTLDQLKPGISVDDVKKLLGSPLLMNTFSDGRMDYVYTNQIGYGERSEQRITCYFKDKRLVKVTGNLHPSQATVS